MVPCNFFYPILVACNSVGPGVPIDCVLLTVVGDDLLDTLLEDGEDIAFRIAVIKLADVKIDSVKVAVRNIEEGKAVKDVAQRVVNGALDELVDVAQAAGLERPCELLRVLCRFDERGVVQIVLLESRLVLANLWPA